MDKKIFIALFILLILPLVSSIPTFQQDQDVFISKTARLDGAVSSAITCNITIRDDNDLTIVPISLMTFNSTSAQQEFFVDGGNHSDVGIYTYPISCQGGGINKTKIFIYEINPSGKAYIPQISGPLIFGAILSLMFLSIFLFIVGAKVDLFPMKVFLIIMSGMVAIMNIGFVAGSFQEFFSINSSLSGSFGTLYIIFIMLLTAASVFLLIWVLLTGFKLYNLKRGFVE